MHLWASSNPKYMIAEDSTSNRGLGVLCECESFGMFKYIREVKFSHVNTNVTVARTGVPLTSYWVLRTVLTLKWQSLHLPLT